MEMEKAERRQEGLDRVYNYEQKFKKRCLKLYNLLKCWLRSSSICKLRQSKITKPKEEQSNALSILCRRLNDPSCKSIYIEKIRHKYKLSTTTYSKWNTLVETLVISTNSIIPRKTRKQRLDDKWNCSEEE